MRPGDTVQTSIKRLLARELHFHLEDLTRVRTIGHYTYCFSLRNEPPQENGNADLAAILAIHVTNEEFASLTYPFSIVFCAVFIFLLFSSLSFLLAFNLIVSFFLIE